MNTRERFKAVMNFEPVDKLPAIEPYWWWDLTLKRWHEEGLPRKLTEHMEIAQYFGLDTHRIFWISPMGQITPEDCAMQKGYVHNQEDYDRLVRPELEREVIFDPAEIEKYAAEQERGEVFCWLQIDGFFWFSRKLLGIEPHLFAFYDQPALLHRIHGDLVEYTLRLIDEVFKICVPELLSFAEDMSYNKGPMISKECFDEFLAPYYRQLIPRIKEYGVTPIADSDGDVAELIPWLQEVGIEGLTPFERMAGNDIVATRKRHPRFKISGAFDKTVMHKGERAIRDEFERIMPVMKSGGYIPATDHQTPPEVSLEDYRLYVSLLHEYCRKAAE